MTLVSFCTPWKHEITRGFWICSGGIEKDQWLEMGEQDRLFSKIYVQIKNWMGAELPALVSHDEGVPKIIVFCRQEVSHSNEVKTVV